MAPKLGGIEAEGTTCAGGTGSRNVLAHDSSVDVQRDAFARDGYVRTRILPDAAEDEIDGLCDELIGSDSRAVYVGNFGESWKEHYIPTAGKIASLIASDDVRVWAQAVAQEELAPHPTIWGNLYRPGEHITWHRDKRGAVQLLVCLRQPPPECGGVFQVNQQGRILEIELSAGEGLLFRATKITHRITPLNPSPSLPKPTRITAVARYFASSSPA